MLCSKKMIFTSKFNVKLQKNFWEALASLGLSKILGGGGFFLRGEGGYQHPTNTLWPFLALFFVNRV
jgi:hypothetical protein